MSNVRVGILISGGGSTALAIIKACQSGRLQGVTVAGVIASKASAGGIAKAQAEGVRTGVISRKDFGSQDLFGEALLGACDIFGADLIYQCGWIPKTPANVIAKYQGMIVNQHPAPLDTGYSDFGGKGMMGRAAHAARLAFVRSTGRDLWTEATAHHVTTEFDKGHVIHRRQVLIKPEDSVIDLQERTLPVEHEVQIETIEMFARGGTLPVMTREIRLVRPNEEAILTQAKQLAIHLFPHG